MQTKTSSDVAWEALEKIRALIIGRPCAASTRNSILAVVEDALEQREKSREQAKLARKAR